jgi:hypothetical protein
LPKRPAFERDESAFAPSGKFLLFCLLLDIAECEQAESRSPDERGGKDAQRESRH